MESLGLPDERPASVKPSTLSSPYSSNLSNPNAIATGPAGRSNKVTLLTLKAYSSASVSNLSFLLYLMKSPAACVILPGPNIFKGTQPNCLASGSAHLYCCPSYPTTPGPTSVVKACSTLYMSM